ncbi:MAG: hypothetical protein CUN57_03520, partial [Phototrophicales bacterium]
NYASTYDVTFTGAGEIYQSVAVAKNASLTFSKATLTYVGEGDYTFEISLDGGSNYTTVTPGTQTTFASGVRGSEIRYRITADTTGGGASFPFGFPAYFGDVIKEIRIEYE